MRDNLRLMAVLAHPDDESLGLGGTLARYASEGVETFLVTATRGENGRHGLIPKQLRRSNWDECARRSCLPRPGCWGFPKCTFWITWTERSIARIPPRRPTGSHRTSGACGLTLC